MNRDDIIRMAREADMGYPTEYPYNNYWTAFEDQLIRFAELVAAAEREKDTALLRQALEVLEDVFGKNKVDVGVITALRARLEDEQ